MAQPFSPEQRDAIRARLLESARQHAISDGVKKTSLDMLTADAGISKSSFYKFYDSKEQLFIEVASQWESDVLFAVKHSLEQTAHMSDKERAAETVYTAFETIHHLGIIRFLTEDWAELVPYISDDSACSHYLSYSQNIFDMLKLAHIHFVAPDDVVLASIRVLYFSVSHANQIGKSFFPALHAIVIGACDELVA